MCHSAPCRTPRRPRPPCPLPPADHPHPDPPLYFFFNDTATTEIYTLSLHDALPIFIPKLRLILILNSFLGSSDSLVFSELFHSLAPRPLAARSISDFLLTYLAT